MPPRPYHDDAKSKASKVGSREEALHLKYEFAPQNTSLGQNPRDLLLYADEMQELLNFIDHETFRPTRIDYKTIMSICKMPDLRTMDMNTQIGRKKAAKFIMMIVTTIGLENMPEYLAQAYVRSGVADDTQIDILVGNITTTIEALTAEEDESEGDSGTKRTSPRVAQKLPEKLAGKSSSETTALLLKKQRKASLHLIYGQLSEFIQRIAKYIVRENTPMQNKFAELERILMNKDAGVFTRDAMNRNLDAGYILLHALGGFQTDTDALMVEYNTNITTIANKLALASPTQAVVGVEKLIEISVEGERADMPHIPTLALHLAVDRISENSKLNNNGLLSGKIQRARDNNRDFNLHNLGNLVRAEAQTIISKRNVQKQNASVADAPSSDAKTIAALTEQVQKLRQGNQGHQKQKRGPPSDDKLKEMSETPCRFAEKCRRHRDHAGTPQDCWYKHHHDSSTAKPHSDTRKIGAITQSSDGEGSDSDYFHSKSSNFGQRGCGFYSSDSEGDDL